MKPLRWLYHLKVAGSLDPSAPYEAASLAREGFLHASFAADVFESGRLYFPAGAELDLLQIDPRRIPAPVDIASTPRGPMPHVHGPIPHDAIRATWRLSDVSAHDLPDQVTGTRFVFVAFEGMTLLDLVAVHDPVSRIRTMGIDPTSSCAIVAAHEGAAWAHDGARFTATAVRPELDDVDVLVVPGGPRTRWLVSDAALVAWLASFPSNRLVASVCTGALLLGASGRLKGKRATTHASALDQLAGFGATPTRERVVDEGQVITAGGVTSGLDLGLHLVRRLAGDAAAERIASQMEMREGWREPTGRDPA